jgi:hypothetical protein
MFSVFSILLMRSVVPEELRTYSDELLLVAVLGLYSTLVPVGEV